VASGRSPQKSHRLGFGGAGLAGLLSGVPTGGSASWQQLALLTGFGA
jgi:hypothetical protein